MYLDGVQGDDRQVAAGAGAQSGDSEDEWPVFARWKLGARCKVTILLVKLGGLIAVLLPATRRHLLPLPLDQPSSIKL